MHQTNKIVKLHDNAVCIINPHFFRRPHKCILLKYRYFSKEIKNER